MLIHHHTIHQQMQRQLLKAKCIQWHIQLFLRADITRQCQQQSCVRGRHIAAEIRRKFRHRNTVATDFLRQGFQQLRHFFGQQARHQIFANRGRYLIDQGQWNRQCHPVIAFARRKVIAQRIAHIVHHQLRRKLVGGDAFCLMPHQIVALQIQQFWRFLLGQFAPRFERRTIVNVGRNQAIVKGIDQLVIHQHIGTA